MGTPSSSLNCLLGSFFLAFAAEGGAMRVPRPAAGTITNTFIRGDQYSTGAGIESTLECPAPNGAVNLAEITASLKRCPDTKPFYEDLKVRPRLLPRR